MECGRDGGREGGKVRGREGWQEREGERGDGWREVIQLYSGHME